MQFLQSKQDVTTQKECTHSKVVKTNNRQNCYHCGIYLPQVLTFSQKLLKLKNSDIIVYRLKSMNYECLMDIERNYQAMFKYDFAKEIDNLNEHYKKVFQFSKAKVIKKQRDEIVNCIVDLGNRLQFSAYTISLGILYMDIINMKEALPPLSFNLYAITCLFVASKAIELDMKIPFISKLRKYSSLHYRPEEIKKAEIHIIKLLDWKLQLCTVTETLDFYFTQGILFSNDQVVDKTLKSIENKFNQLHITEENEKKENPQVNQVLSSLNEYEIKEMLNKMERDALKLNQLITKNLTFFSMDRKQLALACAMFLRKRAGLFNIWNNELAIISGNITEDKVKDIVAKLEEAFEANFNQTSILTHNTYKTNYQWNSKEQQMPIKHYEPYKSYEPSFQRPSTAFLQPRNENLIHQESIPSSRLNHNNDSFQTNYLRQPYQKKLTQEFKNPNDFPFQSRQLYRLNTAYPSIDSRLSKF